VGVISLFHCSPSDGLKKKCIIVSHCISLTTNEVEHFPPYSLAFCQSFGMCMGQVFCLFFSWDVLFLNKHNILLYIRRVLSFYLLEIFHCFVFFCRHCSVDFLCCSTSEKAPTSSSLKATLDVFLCWESAVSWLNFKTPKGYIKRAGGPFLLPGTQTQVLHESS